MEDNFPWLPQELGMAQVAIRGVGEQWGVADEALLAHKLHTTPAMRPNSNRPWIVLVHDEKTGEFVI